MPLLNDADNVLMGSKPVDRVYHLDTIVWQATPDPGGQPTVSDVTQAGTLTVSWPASFDAKTYEVYRNGSLVHTTSSRSYADSGLDWGQEYTYTVIPYNDLGVPGEESPASNPVTIPTGTNTALSASSRSYTNVTVSWTSVEGATHYEVYVNGAGQGQQTALTKNVATTADTTKTIYVRPVRNNVYGTSSGTYSYYSGRAEVRDSGTKNDMQFGPSKLDSWRSVDGWNYLSNIAAQGTYGTYGSYKGVIYYGAAGVRDSLRSKLGSTNRQLNGTCTKCYVYLHKRSGVGSGGAVTTGIYRTNNTASGGEPSGVGGVARTTSSGGTGAWIEIGTAHGQAIGDGTYKSLMTWRDGTTDYAQFENGTLLLSWTWNFVTVTAKANTWSTP